MTDEPKPSYADTIEAQLLVDYVSEGMTLIDACRTLGLAQRTIYDRIDRDEKFAQVMNKARDLGFDAIANQVLAIADDADNDYVEGVDRFGRPKIFLDKEHIQRSRLRADVRVKLLAKWHPKKYGEKLQVETKSAHVEIPIGNDPIAAQRAYEELLKGG